MNLMQLLERGAAHAEASPRYNVPQLRAINATRRQWLNALLVDQTRAWMSLGERQPEVLTAAATMLTLAALVHAYDSRGSGDAELRALNDGIAAAAQCGAAGSTLTAACAEAISAACRHADAIIRRSTAAAVVHAATYIRETAGL